MLGIALAATVGILAVLGMVWVVWRSHSRARRAIEEAAKETERQARLDSHYAASYADDVTEEQKRERSKMRAARHPQQHRAVPSAPLRERGTIRWCPACSTQNFGGRDRCTACDEILPD